jgi:hypothetical protein
MPGNPGLGHAQQTMDCADTELFSEKQLYDAEANRVCEGFQGGKEAFIAASGLKRHHDLPHIMICLYDKGAFSFCQYKKLTTRAD